MELLYYVSIMCIGMFITHFLIIRIIMTHMPQNITFNISKFYISIIIALFAGIIQVIIYDYNTHFISVQYYLTFIFAIAIFIYLYRTQTYVLDKDYLNELIENHSIEILTSEEILQKTNSKRVKKLAENIIATQEAEIKHIRQIIKHE